MQFTYFEFKNFKGIEDQRLDFSKNLSANIFTLVGLNESGKTTILEAINFFSHKTESLDVLGLDNYEIEDIHNLIPINKRDNFNGFISIEAGLLLSDDEITAITNAFYKENDIILSKFSGEITYTQKYHFKNSKHQEEKDQSLWSHGLRGKKKRAKKERNLTNHEAQTANKIVMQEIPSILYFPNFLFEFPDKIYLENTADAKHNFYQKIIQDVLDSLKNDTNIEDHLIDRINSTDVNEVKNLTSIIGKMEKQLSKIVFEYWNDIFNKQIDQKEIVLYTGIDENGAYIEFNIKDDVDTYGINERSLGFRWFFVYILLTQFRSHRKKNSNAFFLFDEPASNLHPSAQSELLKSFENLPSVLYTTHSHYLINPKWLENTYVIKNKGIDYDNEADYKAKNTDVNIMKYREFVSKFPSQTSYFQPILEILEYKPANLELIPKVILTAGKNDFYTFSYYQETIKKYKRPLKFIPGTSSSSLCNLISLYLGWGTKFVVLLDSDAEGVKQKQRYSDIFGDVVKDIVITYQDIDSAWTNFEAESLFSNIDLLKIQNTCYPDEKKYKKKIFNRSIQENYITSTTISLGSQSNSNFIKTLDYLKLALK